MGYSAEVLADSPLAYWRLGEAAGATATDEQATHDGTYVNTPTLGATGAVDDADTAVTFVNASSEYLNTTTLGTLGTGLASSSWEFWIKTTTTSSAQSVLGSASDGSTLAFIMTCNQNQAGASTVGSTRMFIRGTDAASFSGAITTNIYDGAFHHVVVVVDSLTNPVGITWYVDGVSRTVTYNTQAVSPPLANFQYSVHFAGRNFRGVAGEYLDGTLDEIAVYSTRLSAARVEAHYAARGGGGMLLLGIG